MVPTLLPFPTIWPSLALCLQVNVKVLLCRTLTPPNPELSSVSTDLAPDLKEAWLVKGHQSQAGAADAALMIHLGCKQLLYAIIPPPQIVEVLQSSKKGAPIQLFDFLSIPLSYLFVSLHISPACRPIPALMFKSFTGACKHESHRPLVKIIIFAGKTHLFVIFQHW